MSDMGKKMTDAGKSLTTKVTAPIALLGAGIVKIGMDFDKQMSKVAAVSGATGKDFDNLRAKAQELGATTSFSATQAAEGMEYLALAGWKADQILAAMPGMLDLAAAGALELGQAADITSDVMSAFGMSADKATHAADVFAYAQANANTNVEMMGEAMTYLAPVANALGWELEESAAAVMKLADSGVKGSMAGQAFASSLSRLAKPTKRMRKEMKELGMDFFDAQGNIKTLPKVMEEIEKGTKGMTREQKSATLSILFGAEAYKHWAILLESGSKTLADTTEELKNADGTAKRMATTMADNLHGAVITLKSALEGLAIQFSDIIAGGVRKFAEFLTELVRKFGKLDESVKKIILIIAALAASIGPVLTVLGFMVTGLGALITALSTFAVPIAVATAAIVGLTVAGVKLYQSLNKELLPEVDRFGSKVSDSTKQALQGFFDLSDGASQKLRELSITQSEVTEETKNNLVSKFSQMNEQILSKMDERHAKQLEKAQSFFLNSNALATAEEEKILRDLEIRHQAEIAGQEYKELRIQEILNKAVNEKRSLTQSEQKEINSLQQQMNENAVQYLSKNEMESKIIMERMKQSAGALTASQAAEVVKNSNKQKNEAVKAAEQQYDETIAQIVSMRDEMGIITAEQADKMIQDATKQRDSVVKMAEDTHQKVVSEAQAQAGEHVDKVNWETGEVLGIWDVFKQRSSEVWTTIKEALNLDEVFAKLKEISTIVLGEVVAFFQEKLSTLKQFWEENGAQILQAAQNLFQGIMAVVSFIMPAVLFLLHSIWESIKGVITGALDIIMGALKIFAGLFTGDWSLMWEGVKQLLSGALNFLWNLFNLLLIGKLIGGIKAFAASGLDLFKSFGTAVSGTFKSFIDNVVMLFQYFRATGSSIWQALTGTVRNLVTAFTNAIKLNFQGILNSATTIFGKVKSAISNPVEAARDLVKGAVDKIKGFFTGIKLELPQIKVPKLPRFTLTGEFSLKPPSVPKIGIKWNSHGALFKNPTVLDMGPYGYQGFGEGAPEVGLPLTNNVLGQIGRAIERTMTNQGREVIVNVQPAPVFLGDRQVAEIIFKPLKEIMEFENGRFE